MATTLMRSVAIMGGACALLASEVATAQCPGPNTQIIRDPPFHFTYESWVRPPEKPDTAYTYGRCISILNKQWMVVRWDGTQVGGTVAPNDPLMVTFPFVTDLPVESASELRYGIDKIPKNRKQVKFIANAEEVEPNKAQSAVMGAVEKLQSLLKLRTSIDEGVRNATSVARIPVADGTNNFVLTAIFISILDVGTTYPFFLTYVIDGVREPATNFALRPTEGILSAAVRAKLDRVTIPIVGSSGTFAFQGEGNSAATMTVARFELLRGEETIAAFPVSHYAPRPRS